MENVDPINNPTNPFNFLQDIADSGIAIAIFLVVVGVFLLGLTLIVLYLRKRSYRKHPRDDQLNLP